MEKSPLTCIKIKAPYEMNVPQTVRTVRILFLLDNEVFDVCEFCMLTFPPDLQKRAYLFEAFNFLESLSIVHRETKSKVTTTAIKSQGKKHVSREGKDN